jgi:hypothetical protein
MIFADIKVRGRPKSFLKIKKVFRDISVRLEGADSGNYGFGPSL